MGNSSVPVEARLWLIQNSLVSETEKKFVCGRAVPLCLCCQAWDARPILFRFHFKFNWKANRFWHGPSPCILYRALLDPHKALHFQLRLNENSTRLGLGLLQIEKCEGILSETCYLLSSCTQALHHPSSSSLGWGLRLGQIRLNTRHSSSPKSHWFSIQFLRKSKWNDLGQPRPESGWFQSNLNWERKEFCLRQTTSPVVDLLLEFELKFQGNLLGTADARIWLMFKYI